MDRDAAVAIAAEHGGAELARRIDFIYELDRLKTVLRQSMLIDDSRQENSAEHSWHLAMAALTLAPLAAEPIDVERAVKILLVHDIVEIDAGDVFIYDDAKRAAAEAAEQKQQLKVAQQQLSDQTHELEAQSAEINALRNKLVEAQADSDSRAATAQSEAGRLAGELAAAQAALADAQSALSSANASAEQAAANSATQLEEYRTKLANCEAQLEMAGGVMPDPDDLKRIEGIGPKVSSVLIAGGIRTFAQLASASVEQIRQILTDGGMSRINDPGTWPEQAALAVAGDWDALEKLQDELVGGRRV